MQIRLGGFQSARVSRWLLILAFAFLVQGCASAPSAAGPSHVEMTWMSIANMYFEIGDQKILVDGYISRVPEDAFHGGGGGLANTSRAFKPDVAAVRQVLDAMGGPSSVDLLLTGHSHFDHSFDTATWSKLTGAPIVGAPTTCYQVQAEGVDVRHCTSVFGGEKIAVTDSLTMYVIRWNHSGDPAKNPEQHNPVELTSVPQLDAQTGGLRPGVAEDFPNGGGNRAYLFVLDGAQRQFSWFFHDSASAVDLHLPIVVAGKNYGAPLDNLRRAMREAKIDGVDLWIGTGGAPVAKLVLPVLNPKAHIPVHWDGLWNPFLAGVTQPYSDPALETLLASAGVKLLAPRQYMDKWRLDENGTRAISNEEIQKKLAFR